jgi:DNA ligase (NAD+)
MKIEAPTHCPSCNSELATNNFILYCLNTACPAQGYKLIENFGKVLKITGLGPATIKKLDITSIEEIYALSKEHLIEVLGDTLGTKLHVNIEKSKNASLNQVLPALGIPLIGKTAAEKICARFKNISEIDTSAQEVLGPKAAYNLLTWLETNDWKELPFSFQSEAKTSNGKTVCITGKLKSFKTKAEAASYLQAKGYTVVDNLTKSTDILVNESGIESEKTKKASANGTLIVNNLMEL